MQYGIARLAYKDYDISYSCFNTAYGIGSRFEHFDGYQIDNHYARLLLERSIHEPDKHNVFDDFKEANRLLAGQVTNASQNKHYPYRVARLYRLFLETYFDSLSVEQLNYIYHASVKILKQANSIAEYYKDNKYVKSCINDMEHNINILTDRGCV